VKYIQNSQDRQALLAQKAVLTLQQDVILDATSFFNRPIPLILFIAETMEILLLFCLYIGIHFEKHLLHNSDFFTVL